MTLSSIIIQEIRQHGSISFRDFMDMALYYPGLGYYTSAKNKIGKSGDFYTSPNLSPIFGEMIGKQIEEMWHIMGEKEFTVVEMGAGTGLLSGDVLSYLRRNHRFYRDLNFCIIEKSSSLRKEQEARLKGERITWHDSIQEIGKIRGCVYSNELVDAFPVHVVQMEEELMEVFVGFEKHFIEILKPASLQLMDYLKELNIELPVGFRSEINIEAINWLREIACALEKGYIMTVDYGYPSGELYQEYRNHGTLMCYYRHTANDNPYLNIGQQDITSHVNFSALHHWGITCGLELCGLTDQAHFLIGLGIEDHIRNLQATGSFDYYKKILPVKTLLMDMGKSFKILIQKKATADCELSGLRFPSRYKFDTE